jgi:hypothetical protein
VEDGADAGGAACDEQRAPLARREAQQRAEAEPIAAEAGDCPPGRAAEQITPTAAAAWIAWARGSAPSWRWNASTIWSVPCCRELRAAARRAGGSPPIAGNTNNGSKCRISALPSSTKRPTIAAVPK